MRWNLFFRRYATLIGVYFAAFMTGCSNPTGKIKSECETALKDRLRSPSGYHRVSLIGSAAPIPIQEYKAAHNDLSSVQIKALENHDINPTHYTVTIKYDAPNAYGKLVRNASYCEYDASDDKISDVDTLELKIDGKTNHERSLDATRAELEQ